jgi:CRP-like cAMP-binding protein
MVDARRTLARAPLFSHFEEDDLDQVAAALSPRSLGPGAYLVRRGDRPDGLWIIDRGDARVRGTGLDGTATELAQVGPGEVVGLFSLVQDRHRDADVVAATPVDAWFLPRSAFTLLWSSKAPISLRFQMLVARQLARDARDIQAALLREAATR